MGSSNLHVSSTFVIAPPTVLAAGHELILAGKYIARAHRRRAKFDAYATLVNNVCSLCGNKAIWFSDKSYFCFDHKDEAMASQKHWALKKYG